MSTESLKMEAPEASADAPCSPHKKQRKYVINQSDLKKRKESFSACSGPFGVVDAFLILVSLVAYLVDTLTDLALGLQYYDEGQIYWAILTLGLVIVPSIIIQIFSLRWYAADNKACSLSRCLVHLFQLQPLERYLFVLVSGLHARGSGVEEHIENYHCQQNDVCMLRLFEAYLESAPQLTLQLYIMMCTNEANWLTGASSIMSLFALGWAVAAYSHALRRAYQENYRVFWPGLLLQTIWHISIAASRILALVAFASVLKAWVFGFLAVHWVLMTVWAIAQNTDFCTTECEEVLFDGIVGVIYCFSFFNLKEGSSRWRMLAYYSLTFVENAGLVATFFFLRSQTSVLDLVVVCATGGTFLIGLVCMMIYYRWCHPSGPIPCCRSREKKADTSSSVPASFNVPNHSTPHLTKRTSTTSGIHNSHVNKPRPASSVTLSRRSLLLKASVSCKPEVHYTEVFTPSQLSPIKAYRGDPPPSHVIQTPVFADQTDIKLDDPSWCNYQHYSVDATAALQPSRCNTLDVSGIDLSRVNGLDSVSRTARGLHAITEQEALLARTPHRPTARNLYDTEFTDGSITCPSPSIDSLPD